MSDRPVQASNRQILKRETLVFESVGCRGLRQGDAQVSEMHCNFLINHGGASAADIEELGEEVRRRVLEKTGVPLEWEVKRIGIKAVRPQVGVTADMVARR